MEFGFTEEQEAYRIEVREFLEKELPPGWKGLPWIKTITDEEWEFNWAFNRKLATKGWLGLDWPKEYGGQERTHVEALIFEEEIGYHRVPFLGFGPTMIGPTLLGCGPEAEEAKRKWLPKITKAEVSFCVALTEPGAGSDLASLQTRAVEDGDYYIINGQKTYTSFAHRADIGWVLARTDPSAPKHKGISVFIVNMKSPGITIRPLKSIADGSSGCTDLTEVFFDNVRVPKENIVGAKNRGWYYTTGVLNFERLFLGGGFYDWGGAKRTLDEIVEYTKTTERGGKIIAENPIVRQKLAEMAIEIEISLLFAYRLAWMLDNKISPYYEASMVKVFGTELNQNLASVGMQILGLYGPLEEGSKWAFLRGQIEALSLVTIAETIGGGASEIQRDLIANVGLGLPRTRPVG
jgi:hypothetical protein